MDVSGQASSRLIRRTLFRLMVWGGRPIIFHGVGPLVFTAGNIYSAKYIEVLDANLRPVIATYFVGDQWYFQDDNASSHNHRSTENWKRRNDIPHFFWLPQSPDLNLIENVW